MRLLTALVLGFCFAACSSSSTAPSPPPPCCGVTVPFVPGQSFSVNPTSVVFGNQMVNTTSAQRAVTLIQHRQHATAGSRQSEWHARSMARLRSHKRLPVDACRGCQLHIQHHFHAQCCRWPGCLTDR